jgi:hypothetical protein
MHKIRNRTADYIGRAKWPTEFRRNIAEYSVCHPTQHRCTQYKRNLNFVLYMTAISRQRIT